MAGDEEQQPDSAAQSAIQRFRNGMLWKDTVASYRRFFYGLALLFPAVLLGLHMGVFPYFGEGAFTPAGNSALFFAPHRPQTFVCA